MNKPVITLKNVKHAAFASQETHCYSATVYVDGKRWGTVSNEGHGGPDDVEPFKGGTQAIRDLNKRIAETYQKWGSEYNPEKSDTYDMTLEILCGNLVNEFLERREFKKTLKKVCYIKKDEEGVFLLPAKYKPTPMLIKDIKIKAKWAKDCTFLNELPEDEAFELYKKHI